MPRISSLISKGLNTPYVVPGYWHIPTGAVIIYGGSTDPGLAGWTRYSAADGYFIKGTATQSEIGTTYAGNNASLAQTVNTSTGTGGAHTATSTLIAQTYFNGTSQRQNFGTNGGHTHTLTYTLGAGTDINPNSSDMILLQATQEQKYLPSNTWVSASTQHTSGTQVVAATDARYIRGATAKADVSATVRNFSGTTSLDAGHTHLVSYTNDAGPQVSPATTGAWTLNTVYLDASTSFYHSHTVVANIATSRLNGKLLKLWALASQSVPDNNIVLMYTGTIANLPDYWKVCDGTNGTVNMVEYFLGYSNIASTAHDTTTTYTSSISGGTTLSTNTWTHQHASGSYTQTCWPRPWYHPSASVSHTHTINPPTQTTFLPAEIKLCFIQLIKTA